MNRNFVPNDLNPDDSRAVAALYQSLLQRDIPVDSEKLRQWILDWSELESVLGEVSCRRYVAMTCNTADEKAAKAYEDFVENIQPVMNEYDDKLNKKLVAHPAKDALKGEFGEWFKGVQVSLDLFSPENIPLETEENKEIQAYQKITGGMSVEFEGETKTMQQMATYMERTDRELRERAWRTMWERRLQDKEALDKSFDNLFSLRKKIAKNAHCKDFIDYIFLAKHRFDYSPADCEAFHESIEKLVLPMQKEMYRRRAQKMGLERLRPWDLSVDPQNRAPLKPYTSGDELIEKVDQIFESIHPQAGKWAREMQAKKLIDPDSRLGKAPGGYQIGFDESRLPFIFMNSACTDRDIYTLLHESGHSFHQFALAGQPIFPYRDVPAEFAEVASMSMELIGMSNLKPFYGDDKEAIERSTLGELEDVVWLFPWVASVDSFQHRLYNYPTHTAEDRSDIWDEIMDRYDAGVDYTGLEAVRRNLWQKQLHIFECPFYYIEYGIAQIGALQVWANFKKDPKKAIDDLFKAESLGSSRPVKELFEAANIKFDFSPKTLEPLMQVVWDELK
ncbi:M3 family oligoendopeptidase [Fibrobacter sp. UWR2]|uniref:M3 family oligoendopeptidase n=1 Tax=Fibrobacter sp. UWR2 TaxID=1964352 RepID=UPI000B528B29|nr:M3 family oligoendopeptidase [Fibrobacter sp. UWR2]OWV01183.1 M3 family oligoendopeptidase [Fibrobacter sp. UWR2]